jgi:hypothetical protein
VTSRSPEPFVVWTDTAGKQGYLHGTKADLAPGDLIEAGRASKYGAELAIGETRGRIARAPSCVWSASSSIGSVTPPSTWRR